MQKLMIKSQFMGVKPCEIELRRFLLLIGEQASGKSTIAKLSYFFQTLPDAIYKNALFESVLTIYSGNEGMTVDKRTYRGSDGFSFSFFVRKSSRFQSRASIFQTFQGTFGRS